MSILNKPFIDEWTNAENHFNVEKTLIMLEDMMQQASEIDGNKQTALSAKQVYLQLKNLDNLVSKLKERRDNEQH